MNGWIADSLLSHNFATSLGIRTSSVMTDFAKLLSMSFSTCSMAPCKTDVASMGAGAGSDGSEKSLWGVAR